MRGRGERERSVAIVGDGPASSTLAILLARRGLRVAIFGMERRPALIIGESLVPSLTPLLRELGVEEEVWEYSVLKPGATFVLHARHARKPIVFRFGVVPSTLPGYTYNTPRDRFDETLRGAAERAGARLFRRRARFERVASDAVRLDADSIAATDGFLGGQPDYLIDATGRRRTLARLLDLPKSEGERCDVALFAHHDAVPITNAGHVHNDFLDRGWCWRIPLQGRVSLGVVVDGKVLRDFGASPEAQYDGFLQHDPWLKGLTEASKRVTPVMRYANYQLTTLRGAGPLPPPAREEGVPRWALLGDAFGFVDPVFASGLFLAMHGAKQLARAILRGTDAALQRYSRGVVRHVDAWRRVVGYFYDGRLIALFQVKERVEGTPMGRLLNPHVAKHVARVLTGEAPTRRTSLAVVDFMVRHGLMDENPDDYRVL